MIEELHKQQVNSELEKYVQNMEKEKESFSFIEINFLVDMRIAENRYKEDFKNERTKKNIRLANPCGSRKPK